MDEEGAKYREVARLQYEEIERLRAAIREKDAELDVLVAWIASDADALGALRSVYADPRSSPANKIKTAASAIAFERSKPASVSVVVDLASARCSGGWKRKRLHSCNCSTTRAANWRTSISAGCTCRWRRPLICSALPIKAVSSGHAEDGSRSRPGSTATNCCRGWPRPPELTSPISTRYPIRIAGSSNSGKNKNRAGWNA